MDRTIHGSRYCTHHSLQTSKPGSPYKETEIFASMTQNITAQMRGVAMHDIIRTLGGGGKHFSS